MAANLRATSSPVPALGRGFSDGRLKCRRSHARVDPLGTLALGDQVLGHREHAVVGRKRDHPSAAADVLVQVREQLTDFPVQL